MVLRSVIDLLYLVYPPKLIAFQRDMSHWCGPGFYLMLSAVNCSVSTLQRGPERWLFSTPPAIKGAVAQDEPSTTLVPFHAATTQFISRCWMVKVKLQER